MIKEIRLFRNQEISKVINDRLKEFEILGKSYNKVWFSELCFCILTANSRAKSAIQIQKEIGVEGFQSFSQSKIKNVIIKNKHRFHNNKSKYIIEARKFIKIKDLLRNLSEEEAREFIVKNIKGLGYKEASHFLRNVGYKNLAILDRHILNLMEKNKLIVKPNSLNKKSYLEIEKKFKKIAGKLNMSCAELDLYMWFMKTGNVLK